MKSDIRIAMELAIAESKESNASYDELFRKHYKQITNTEYKG